MTNSEIEINANGKRIKVPAVEIGERIVIVRGRWIRSATVHQEDWMEDEPVKDPDRFITELKARKVKSDIFSFSPRLPETTQRHRYHVEWDNVAAIPVSTYEEWWQKRLSRKTRQEVARAKRFGVTVKVVPWDDKLIKSIVKLFGEIVTKQGMPFNHHGKDYATVERDLSSYKDRSEFLGAYCENELIGYLKIVYMGKNASILNIISNDAHFEKRPSNALIAKAVEVCAQNGMQHLIYGKFTYGNKTSDSLAEFKRRNGFEKVVLPRYYVPLSFKGRIIMKLKFHRGLLGILPGGLIAFLLKCRSVAYMKGVWPVLSVMRRRGHPLESKAREAPSENQV